MELKFVDIDGMGMTSVFRLFKETGELVIRNSQWDFDEILDLDSFEKALEKLDTNRIFLICDEGIWNLELRSVTNERGPIPIGGSTL